MVGPLTGAVIAVTAFDHLLPLQTLTAKLSHDSRYPSTMATRLAPSPTESVLRARYGPGDAAGSSVTLGSVTLRVMLGGSGQRGHQIAMTHVLMADA